VINRISKSQYLKGLQCHKALWFYRHRRDLYPEIPEARQRLFDSGHEVGQMAQAYFENGIEIKEKYYEIDKAIAATVKAVNQGYEAIFEATACSSDGAFSRIDILKKVDDSDEWDLIEVKQSTGVKDYHIHDMALQRYAFEGAGYNIRKSILMHVDNQYVRRGNIDIKAFFALEDCTGIVKSRLPDVPGFLTDLLAVLNTDMEPFVEIGDFCIQYFQGTSTAGDAGERHPRCRQYPGRRQYLRQKINRCRCSQKAVCLCGQDTCKRLFRHLDLSHILPRLRNHIPGNPLV